MQQLHLTIAAVLALAPPVNLTGDEFFPRTRFTEDQDAGVGCRNEINLLQHILKRRAVSDDVAELVRSGQFLTQIVPFQFELLLQLGNLFEGPRVGDRGCGMVGDHAHPG